MLTAVSLQRHSQVAAQDHRRRWSVLILRGVGAVLRSLISASFGGLIGERQSRSCRIGGGDGRIRRGGILGVNSVQTLEQNDGEQQQELSAQQNITHRNHLYSHNIQLIHLNALLEANGNFRMQCDVVFWFLRVFLLQNCKVYNTPT